MHKLGTYGSGSVRVVVRVGVSSITFQLYPMKLCNRNNLHSLEAETGGNSRYWLLSWRVNCLERIKSYPYTVQVQYNNLVLTLCLYTGRVPSHSGNQGKPWKGVSNFPVRENSGNLVKTHKNQGKLREFVIVTQKGKVFASLVGLWVLCHASQVVSIDWLVIVAFVNMTHLSRQ